MYGGDSLGIFLSIGLRMGVVDNRRDGCHQLAADYDVAGLRNGRERNQ